MTSFSLDPDPSGPGSDRQPHVAPPPSRGRRGVVPLVLAALLGGGVAAAAVETTHDNGTRPTTVTVASPTPAAAASFAPPATTTGKGATVADDGVKSIQQIYRETSPGVVRIDETTAQGKAEGSGFVISKDGYVLTNAHVVNGGGNLTVLFSNHKRVKATVVGIDNGTDVALLRVAVDFPLTVLPLGRSSSVQVGDAVVAIGNPFGLDLTATSGIISALNREITSPNQYRLTGALQTDAAINHGNSGGPLLNNRGEVVGINAQIADSGVNANVGVGFAIPVDTVRNVADQLKATGHAKHAWLGISLGAVDDSLVQKYNLSVKTGVLIGDVKAGGPAQRAGLRQTDVLTAIDGAPIVETTDLEAALERHQPGDRVTFKVARGRQTLDVGVTLGDQPQALQQQSTQQTPDPFSTP